MNVSIRCPECAGLNADRDARFAPPRQYSPEIALSAALHNRGADLVALAGKVVACGDVEIVRRLYTKEIHAALNSIYDALSAFENGDR